MSKKGSIPWNKGKPTGYIPWNKGKINVYTPKQLKQMSETRTRLCIEGKIVPWNKGKPWSDEIKTKIREANRGKTYEEIYGEERAREMKIKNRERMMGENNPFFGKHHTDESKKKDRDAHIGKKHSEEWKQKLSLIARTNPNYGMKGKHHTEEHKQRMSEQIKNHWKNPNSIYNSLDYKKRTSKLRKGENNSFYGKHHTNTTKIRMREMWDTERIKKHQEKIKERWQNPEFIRKVMTGQNKKPNKAEKSLYELLQKHYPNQWKFNGDFSQGIMFGGKIPDFITTTNQKKVIELFGEHVHSPLQSAFKQKIPYHQTYQGTLEHYKKYGYGCTIIWSKELKQPEKVIEKINKGTATTSQSGLEPAGER